MKFKLLFILLIFFSCNTTQKSIIGRYISKNETFFDKMSDDYDYWTIGSTLDLKKDSTFYMKNCGNILEGKWEKKNDSVFLFISSNKYVIDSLNRIPKWKEQLKFNKEEPVIYVLKKNILYKKTFSTDDGNQSSLVQKLIKK